MRVKKRLRLLPLVMTIMMMFAVMFMIGSSAHADGASEVTIGGVKYSLINDESNNKVVSVTGCIDFFAGEVAIPDTVAFNGIEYPVTSVGREAFSGKDIKSVTIPSGVTSIGNKAFYCCQQLRTVTIAQGSALESIGERAFWATGITSITIPAGVTSIGKEAFSHCESLGAVSIEKGSALESIGESAFKCTGITSIAIPAGVMSIGESAFIYCEDLETVSFEKGSALESIGNQAFRETGITSITIPAGVKSIGEGAFWKTGITSITIPAGVTSIGEAAFYYCSSLRTVSFEKGTKLESIENSVFGWTGITSITIPAGVTSIGKNAFYSCKNLGKVIFEKESKLESIGDLAFESTGITSIAIPSGVTSIGERAFLMTGITSITIPAGVMSIGERAFYYCKDLETVSFEKGSALESIGASAFYNTAITSIAIPAGVTSIGDGAFMFCENLETVIFAQGSGLESIGNSAFWWTGITSVTIPAGVTSIGDNAFTGISTVFFIGDEDQWNGMPGIDDNWAGGRDVSAFYVDGAADVPTGKTLVYNGKEQTGVEAGDGYTLNNSTATSAGSYQATATLASRFVWTDGTTEPRRINWEIEKAIAEDKVAIPVGKTFTYNGKAQMGVASGANYTLAGTTKTTNVGVYTATAALKEHPDPNYEYAWTDGTTGAKYIKWTINKAANPLTIRAKTAIVKGSTKGKKGKLKKTKTLTVGKVVAFTRKGQGKMTYTKISGNKKVTINKTSGKVTVKKGLKKGTYKVKVKVKAAGNANYKASSMKTITFKIKVK